MNEVVIEVPLQRVSEGAFHLTGALAARTHLEEFRTSTREYLGQRELPIVPLLDFSGIESCTSSYIKSSLGWLQKSGEKSIGAEGNEDPGDGTVPVALSVYPVVANLTSEVREELEVIAQSNDCCWVEALEFGSGKIQAVRIIGNLERTIKSTLQRVVQEGSVTATELHTKYDDGINITGWNNRLLELHRLRLLHRRKDGRQWIYMPLWEVSFG